MTKDFGTATLKCQQLGFATGQSGAWETGSSSSPPVSHPGPHCEQRAAKLWELNSNPWVYSLTWRRKEYPAQKCWSTKLSQVGKSHLSQVSDPLLKII